MASKVLVPAAPFAKLQVKKSPPETAGAGFIISGDAAARVTHLEHSVRFLQEQHRLMLSGLHAEIEALRERNRDLQFQLIFNKESSPKPTSPNTEDNVETEEAKLKREVSRLEKEAATARSEARAAEARALQLQRLVDTQTEKLRVLELSTKCTACVEGVEGGDEQAAAEGGEGSETRAELRARLAEAERLVRRLRGDAERRRREVPDLNRDGRGPTSVTNLLFDGAANTHAHLQCMKNSLHASLRATGLDSYGFHNKYHFPPAPPPVHTPDFWREPMREDYNIGGRGRSTRRPLTLPELSGQTMHRSTVYANNHTRPRANGYDKNKKSQPSNGEVANGKSPEEQPESRLYSNFSKVIPHIKDKSDLNSNAWYPELKIVVTKMIPHGNVSNGQTSQTTDAGARARPRRHRKHVDHT